MKAQHINSEYTGSCEGNPDSRVRGSDLWRRPSTELEPVATFSGSVRSDRCNKSRSPRANAPSATRASKTSLPNVVHSMDDKGTPPNPTCFRPGSTYPPSFRRGLGGGHECQAKGRVSGREFGRRRTLVANGSRLRHEDVQNYPMGSGRAQTQGRNPGPRSGNVGSDRTREASSPISRTKRQRLMDWHLTRKVSIPFNGKNKTTAPNH